MPRSLEVEKAYQLAKERYAELGVDTDLAIRKLAGVSISLHCWQGDDVCGFERPDAALMGGGILATGNHPGKARTAQELRADLEKACSLIPGNQRVNLHAIYGEFGDKFVDRNEYRPEHFAGWVQWAKANNLKLDFNTSCFSHPKAGDDGTLSHRDPEIRNFWIEHTKCCREICAYIGEELGSPCIHDIWIPDGSKDVLVDRTGPRARLKESLDTILAVKYSPNVMRDALECKLFGLGAEYYTVGSHEFYMGYALSKGLMLCLDMGHFHPTESVADKLSAIRLFFDEVLLHISRGVRWDSDHVVIFNDDVRDVTRELVRTDWLNKAHISLDFFDATLNRVGAWITGARATQRGILAALLEPSEMLEQFENTGRRFERLALLDELKTLPMGAVWDYFCAQQGVPGGTDWIKDVSDYEATVLSKRGA